MALLFWGNHAYLFLSDAWSFMFFQSKTRNNYREFLRVVLLFTAWNKFLSFFHLLISKCSSKSKFMVFLVGSLIITLYISGFHPQHLWKRQVDGIFLISKKVLSIFKFLLQLFGNKIKRKFHKILLLESFALSTHTQFGKYSLYFTKHEDKQFFIFG